MDEGGRGRGTFREQGLFCLTLPSAIPLCALHIHLQGLRMTMLQPARSLPPLQMPQHLQKGPRIHLVTASLAFRGWDGV